VIKIRNLDEREKALNMYFLEGKSYGYISENLKISKNTIQTWCRRYRIKNDIPTRGKEHIKRKPVDLTKLHERKGKDEPSSEARIARLEMEVELLRNFLILSEGR
jgi:transposase